MAIPSKARLDVAPAHVGISGNCGISWQALDLSRGPEDMNLPGFRLHELKGRLKGHWAVSVSGNWRVTFRFEDGAAVDVDFRMWTITEEVGHEHA